jgi:hypothetical protein
MANHHVKLFVVDGAVYYIHHNTSAPSDDDPGPHAEGATGDNYRWKARDDGGFKIEFDTESPFVSGHGAPGSPIVSPDGSQTPLEPLKVIGTPKRSFKYTFTFDSGVTDDPQIIINNSGGGGGSPKKKSKKKK